MWRNNYQGGRCPFCGSKHVVDEGMWEHESREWCPHWSCISCCRDWDDTDFITSPTVFRFAERQYGFDLNSVWKVSNNPDRPDMVFVHFKEQESGKAAGIVLTPLSDFGDLQVLIWSY